MSEEQALTLSIEPTYCKCCFEKINETDQFCQACGFPLKAIEEDQNRFIYNRNYQHLELQGLNAKIKSAGTTLYVLAGFFLLFGLGYFLINRDRDTSSGIGYLIKGLKSAFEAEKIKKQYNI